MSKPDFTTSVASVDLTAEVCPMTFVRAKVALEKIAGGQLVELVIRGAEALQDIPRSLKAEGHRIEAVQREADGRCRLQVRKNGLEGQVA